MVIVKLGMKLRAGVFVIAVAVLAGCQRQPTWKLAPVMPGDDSDSSVAASYKTTDDAWAVVWKYDRSLQLEDTVACQRRLSRYAEFRDGGKAWAKGSVAYAFSRKGSSMAIWVKGRPHGRWVGLGIPKGKPWLPYAQSFLSEVMKEPGAAADLNGASETDWSYTHSVIEMKSLGQVELPSGWFQMFEALGGAPDKGDSSLWLRGSQGTVDIGETTAAKFPKSGFLKYSGFDMILTKEGITALKSRRYRRSVAYVVRNGDRIVIVKAGAGPDPHVLQEAKKLASFFESLLRSRRTK